MFSLFGNIPKGLSRSETYISKIFKAASKKKKKAPTIALLTNVVDSIHSEEKLTSSLQPQRKRRRTKLA